MTMDIAPDVRTNWSRNDIEAVVKDVLIQEGVLGIDSVNKKPIAGFRRASTQLELELTAANDEQSQKITRLEGERVGLVQDKHRLEDQVANLKEVILHKDKELERMEDINEQQAMKLANIQAAIGND